jgi:hypothetical protein
MAITLSKVNLGSTNHVIGNRREINVDFTLDSSYPTGGYALTLATLGVDGVTDHVIAFPTTTGHTFTYNYSTQKLMAFVGGTEVSSTTDLHTVVGRLVASGKGNPNF